jgi:hypothetical protein
MKGILTIMCMCIIPMIGITQSNINIYSNFNYTKIEKKVHNRWTVLSSKYESNTFKLNNRRVLWIGKNKTKEYEVTQYWVFEGKPTYTVKDSKGEILVFQIIPNESIQLLWLDRYSRRMAIVFDILD